MGLFDEIREEFEENRERRAYREMQEEIQEERVERYLAEEDWEMQGMMYDPYMHGQLFFDPMLGHHGVMYNGIWHPLEFIDGQWIFVHPSRFNVPRYYQPQGLLPPQMPGYYR